MMSHLVDDAQPFAADDLEAPMCLEVSGATVQAIELLLSVSLPPTSGDSGAATASLKPQDAAAVTEAAVDILRATLHQLASSGVDPLKVGLGGELEIGSLDDAADAGAGSGASGTVAAVRMRPMDVVVKRLLSLLDARTAVGSRAADTLREHLRLLMRAAPDASTDGLSKLLSAHLDNPLPQTSAQYKLLTAMIACITGSGSGVDDFLQVPPTGPGSTSYAQQRPRVTIRGKLNMLLRASATASAADAASSAASGTPATPGGTAAGGGSGDTGDFAVPLLREYQRTLLRMAYTSDSDSWAPCVALADYAHAVLNHATKSYEEAAAVPLRNADTALAVESHQRASVAGVLLLELVTGLCVLWRRRFVADSLLPALCRLTRAVDAFTVRVGGGRLAVPGAARAGILGAAAAVPSSPGLTPTDLEISFEEAAPADPAEAMLLAEARYTECFARTSTYGSRRFGAATGSWLLELTATLAWLGARLAGVLVSGVPLNSVELRLSKWLSTPLLSTGIDQTALLPHAAKDALDSVLLPDMGAASAGGGGAGDAAMPSAPPRLQLQRSNSGVQRTSGDPDFFVASVKSEWRDLAQEAARLSVRGVSGAALDEATDKADERQSDEMHAWVEDMMADKRKKAKDILSWLAKALPIDSFQKSCEKKSTKVRERVSEAVVLLFPR